MIIVTKEDIVLGPDELNQLDAFFKSYTGKRMIQAVAAQRPPVLPDVFSAGKVAGYEEAINNLLELVGAIPQIVEDKMSNYPDLDDDEKWSEELPQPRDSL